MASVPHLEDAETFVFVKAAAGDGAGFHLHLIAADTSPEKSERLFRDWLLAH